MTARNMVVILPSECVEHSEECLNDIDMLSFNGDSLKIKTLLFSAPFTDSRADVHLEETLLFHLINSVSVEY